MKPVITAFKDSPDEGQGLARDMGVRWALEEVGQPYDVRLVTFDEMEEPEYLAIHPFGLIPAYQDGHLTLCESGAIILYIAERHDGVLPKDLQARARAIMWMFAAASTVEPTVVELEYTMLVEQEKPWYEQRLPTLRDRIRENLSDLSRRLGTTQWLDGAFSAGDIMMVLVLRRLEGTHLLEEHQNLVDYVARGQARPAYQRAFADQLAVFTGKHRKS